MIKMKMRDKFLFPTMAIAIIVTVVLIIAGTTIATGVLKKSVVDSNRETLDTVQKGLDRTAKSALEISSLFAKAPFVLEAYRKAYQGNIDDEKDPNLQLARDDIRKGMKRFNAGYHSVIGKKSLKIHYHLPPARSLVRVWRKKQAKRNGEWVDISDNLSSFRKTVLKVNKERKPVKGLELGRGGFTIRGLAPITAPDGTHLGSNEVLINYFDLVKQYRTNKRNNFALYMDHKYKGITTKLHNKPGKHPTVKGERASFVFIGSTKREVTDKIVKVSYLEKGVKEKTHFRDGDHFIALAPVKDFEGKAIGVLALVSDSSEAFAGIASTRRWLIGVSLAALILMVVMLFLVSRYVMKPVRVLIDAVQELSRGNLQCDLDIDTNDEIGELADDFRLMVQAQQQMTDAARSISQGDFSVDIVPRSDEDSLAIALQEMVGNIRNITGETSDLVRAMEEGQLSVRGDTSKYSGGWKELIGGINQVVEEFNDIVDLTSNCVGRIAKGDLPREISGAYNGDLRLIKTSLESCVSNIRRMIDDTRKLSQAAVDGHLDTRADTSQHSGDYKLIVDGINQTLDAVVNPITEARDVLERLANYDLQARMVGEYRGDHNRMKRSINATADVLHDALARVSESAHQLCLASTQIASASQDLAEGANVQAMSIQTTSSTLQKIAAQTDKNAESTRRADGIASSTQTAVNRGAEAMTEMSVAMRKIQKASDDTAQILRDVNEIAFQTNLLALNAAVEAARAGDAGRGFAVVAQEVRNLAQRSKEAAKRTEELITESVSLAEQGYDTSERVQEHLTEIKGSVIEVSQIVAEISEASTSQANSIREINVEVNAMDSSVQATAAATEESSSAAEELATQAKDLAKLVEQFQLEEDSNSSDFDNLLGESDYQSEYDQHLLKN